MKTVNIVTTIHLLFFLFATFFLVQVGLYEERKVLNIVESTKYKGINPFTFRMFCFFTMKGGEYCRIMEVQGQSIYGKPTVSPDQEDQKRFFSSSTYIHIIYMLISILHIFTMYWRRWWWPRVGIDIATRAAKNWTLYQRFPNFSFFLQFYFFSICSNNLSTVTMHCNAMVEIFSEFEYCYSPIFLVLSHGCIWNSEEENLLKDFTTEKYGATRKEADVNKGETCTALRQ